MRTQSLLAALLLALALPAGLAAQGATGRIEGRVVDARTGAPLGGARVVLQGSQDAAVTGTDGRFSLARVPVGSRTVAATLMGYTPATVPGVQVQAAEVARVDVKLAAQALALEGLTVTAGAARGSVSRAMEQQRSAAGVVNAVGAEQIARSPDSDAAQVVQRVSGVTVQDGRYVFVRGLGERYSTTSLNGARLPSPEPDRRTVPLDLFPSGILDGITVSKTFTPDLPGDFSGAQVNLRTRSFPTRRTASLSFSGGFNDAATFRDVLVAPGGGMDWLAFAGSGRQLPSALAGGAQLNDFGQISEALSSFRNVWTADRASGRPNGSLSASVGGQDDLLGRPLGYVATLSYSASQEVRRGEERAFATLGGSGGGTQPYNAFTGSTGRTSVLWGGVLNLSTQLGEGSRVSFNNTYDRTSDNEAIRLFGNLEEFGVPVDVTRLSFIERSIYSSQLQASHVLGGRHKLDWSGTLSGVERDEPDRSDLTYARETDPRTGEQRGFAWLGNRSRSATRTFSALSEQARTADLAYTLQLGGDAGVPGSLKLGGLYRNVERDSDTRAYDLLNRGLTDEQRTLPAEELFSGRFFDPADPKVTLRQNVNGGFYTASDHLGAGYVMLDYPLSDRVRVVGGARVEHDRIEVDAVGVNGARTPVILENTDVLPALAVNWDPTDNQRVRLSATQTLSRPEYRELSPTAFFDVLGLLNFGNPGLERALIRNYDLRWELYPSDDELLSVALFAKDFDRPLERILVQSTGASSVSFVNTEGAVNYGVELEARKGLGTLASFLEPLSFFSNVSLIRSEITVGNRGLVSLTSDHRPMAGQAPYVVNAGLTWSGDTGRNATVLYNVVGKRISEVGTGGLPDTYELPRHVLDLSFQLPLLGGGSTLKLDAKNLLDSPFHLEQGSVTRHRYTTGRTFSLGVALRR
ncbi:MAG TPA: TonB-dependent receptor [Longimicrobiaceae bacterium]